MSRASSFLRIERGLTAVISAPGRTTFVNTLCGKTVLPHKDSDDPSTAHIEEGVKIKPVTVGTQETIPARLKVGTHCDLTNHPTNNRA